MGGPAWGGPIFSSSYNTQKDATYPVQYEVDLTMEKHITCSDGRTHFHIVVENKTSVMKTSRKFY